MRKSREDRGGGDKKANREGKYEPKTRGREHKDTCNYIGLWARDSLSDSKALVVLRAGSIAFT